jgi:putative ABC transport system permease protein
MVLFGKLKTAVALAFDSIRAHKLRSFLTLLGVIVGVASVVLVGAAIGGLGSYAESITARAFGSDSFLVAHLAAVGRLDGHELARKQKYNKYIHRDDLKFLRLTTGDQILYSPYQQRIEDVKAENQVFEGASVIGVSADMPQIRDIPIALGRFIVPAEEQNRRPVAVIGDDVKNT